MTRLHHLPIHQCFLPAVVQTIHLVPVSCRDSAEYNRSLSTATPSQSCDVGTPMQVVRLSLIVPKARVFSSSLRASCMRCWTGFKLDNCTMSPSPIAGSSVEGLTDGERRQHNSINSHAGLDIASSSPKSYQPSDSSSDAGDVDVEALARRNENEKKNNSDICNGDRIYNECLDTPDSTRTYRKSSAPKRIYVIFRGRKC